MFFASSQNLNSCALVASLLIAGDIIADDENNKSRATTSNV